MAGPFTIQRNPAGLLNVIGNFGGQTPPEMAAELRGQLELLQMFGLTQLQSLSTTNAAAAEGAGVVVQLPASWCVLFSANCFVTKTATMTALRVGLGINRTGGIEMGVADIEGGPFGATETGGVTAVWFAPYPVLCPPSSRVIGRPNIIGTDATANVIVAAEFGVLG